MVFDPGQVSDDEIARMDEAGARALRIQLVSAGGLDLSTIERAVDEGDEPSRCYALANLANLEFRAGRWDVADRVMPALQG